MRELFSMSEIHQLKDRIRQRQARIAGYRQELHRDYALLTRNVRYQATKKSTLLASFGVGFCLRMLVPEHSLSRKQEAKQTQENSPPARASLADTLASGARTLAGLVATMAIRKLGQKSHTAEDETSAS